MKLCFAILFFALLKDMVGSSKSEEENDLKVRSSIKNNEELSSRDDFNSCEFCEGSDANCKVSNTLKQQC